MKKSPDNDKIRRAASVESSEKQAQKVRQMESRIARLDEVEEPRKEWQLQFSIGQAPRSSAVVATLRNVVARQGDFTLGPVNLQLNGGERIGITGPNGAGKSTLLRLLLGTQEPDDGDASMGASVAVGEIDQARGLLDGGSPLGDAVEAVLVDWNSADVRTLLAKFGLKADHTSRTVDSLSPGERTRAALALLQARGVNLLVLDEPTNHLDLPAIEQLEEALESYDGALLLVTHDRRLLENVRLDSRLAPENGTGPGTPPHSQARRSKHEHGPRGLELALQHHHRQERLEAVLQGNPEAGPGLRRPAQGQAHRLRDRFHRGGFPGRGHPGAGRPGGGRHHCQGRHRDGHLAGRADRHRGCGRRPAWAC